MDESRKQFEAWFMETHGIKSGILNFNSASVCISWSAWQASRAAIEIHTPDLVGDDDNSLAEYDEGYNRGIILCDNAIIKHGLKVKVKE